jgi:hypothetical protein
MLHYEGRLNRLRAAKPAELDKLPVRVVKLSDAEAIEALGLERVSDASDLKLCWRYKPPFVFL